MYSALLPYSHMPVAADSLVVDVFEYHISLAVLCARFLNHPLTPNEFIESHMSALSCTLAAVMNYSLPPENDDINVHGIIFVHRASVQRAYQYLAEHTFKRQPDIMIATQIGFIERALSSQYGLAEEEISHLEDLDDGSGDEKPQKARNEFAASKRLSHSTFTSSLLTPLMPSIRQFSQLTLNHLMTVATFFNGLHTDVFGTADDELKVYHEDMILISLSGKFHLFQNLLSLAPHRT